MRPIAIPEYILQHNLSKEILQGKTTRISTNFKRLYSASPDVSVIIPAYNEEESILKTLSSLSFTATSKSVEVIVVNNNSHDATKELAVATGANCITEIEPGITAARNAGLKVSTGKIIMNADADTIYPPKWIDLMTDPLKDNHIAMVYGSFAFIPTKGASRSVYAGYEYLSGFSRWLNRNFREEAVNVYGFNSAFRRHEGMQAGGFDHPPGTNEDGWLALKLRNTLNKKLFHLRNPHAMVWTSDRRIHLDGGLVKGIWKRVKRAMRYKI